MCQGIGTCRARSTDRAGGLACTLQSPHTIQDRRGGMKPTKLTNAPEARFAMVVSEARDERIATSASRSRSRHESFGCYEMCL
jgi:hypothetical protein